VGGAQVQEQEKQVPTRTWEKLYDRVAMEILRNEKYLQEKKVGKAKEGGNINTEKESDFE